MRFCPFCSSENVDEGTHCATCARRLPPLPPRRRTTTAAVEASGPGDEAAVSAVAKLPTEAPATPPVAADLEPARIEASPPRSPTPVASPAAAAVEVTARGASRKEPSLLSRVALGPAAARRRAETGEVRTSGAARRKTDAAAPGTWEPPRHRPPTLDDPPEADAAAAVGQAVAAVAAEVREVRSATPLRPIPARAESPASPQSARATSEVLADPEGTGTIDLSLDDAELLTDLDVEAAPRDRRRTESTPPPLPLPRPPTPGGQRKEPTLPEPPPTRIAVGDEADASLRLPEVMPVPEVPEPGFVNAARYSIQFLRSRWQRRSAIQQLSEGIQKDTDALDAVLGTLGKIAREVGVDSRVFAAENQAIDDAETRRTEVEQATAALNQRQTEENARFAEIERDRDAKVAEALGTLEGAQGELATLEAQRRGLRDKRKAIERQQRGYLKAAEEREEEAGSQSMGDARQGLRRAAEELRKDAAALDPERQDLERRLQAVERPISQAASEVETYKADLDSARRSLQDAREGHRHRLAELEAEHSRRTRELAQAAAEIQRRLVTLGTLVNLNRVENDAFKSLYERIDGFRAAIGMRSTEIDRLTAEREAYDRASLVRGYVVIGASVVGILTIIAVLLAIL